jgi:hydroxyacylglutathione hydrolase
MPLAVERLELGPLGTNCYLVRATATSPEAVVVDPSGPAAEIRLRLASLGARCAAILVTHGHWDHLLGVAELAEGTGAPVHMPSAERALLERADAFTPPGVPIRSWIPEVDVAAGDSLELAGITFRVLDAPGHSPGHVAYLTDGHLFSGDVLFKGSVGRTDLPGADWETLLASIRHLLDEAGADTLVLPGHGPETTLGAELATNPFLADLREDRTGSDA